jgi:uncharacterized membrane protein SirB2
MWIIPAVQTVHILCVAVVMTSMAMLDFRLLGFAGRDSVSSTVRRFVPRVWYTLPLMIVTGIILIVGEPDRELLNPYFRAKMVMLALVLAITLAVQGLSKKDGYWETRKAAAVVAGSVSLLLWIFIVTVGRWIAYY